MPRPPLPIGTYGTIGVFPVAGGGFRAVAKFRDLDGVTRKVGRTGATAAIARNRLREHFRDRARQGPASGLSGDTRFRVVADEWIAGVHQLAMQGTRSPNTAQIYRLALVTHVLPALGELRLHEVTVPRLDRFLQTLQLHKGTPTAKLARSVLSGVLGRAVRHGVIPTNPVRDTERITGQRRRPPRALTPDERRQWVAQLGMDPNARRKDLPDLCEWMLGTGVRIGEALAVSWDEIDLAAGTARIEFTTIRVKGVGLIRKGTKTSAGERTLTLPAFVVSMLRRRRMAAGGAGPVFPDSLGGWRDPSNTSRDLRNARGSAEFAWVTSHVFRKTAATELDRAGLSARQIADQLGHSRPSITQDYYMGRHVVTSDAARALDRAYRDAVDDDPERVSGA
jgi:integrase